MKKLNFVLLAIIIITNSCFNLGNHRRNNATVNNVESGFKIGDTLNKLPQYKVKKIDSLPNSFLMFKDTMEYKKQKALFSLIRKDPAPDQIIDASTSSTFKVIVNSSSDNSVLYGKDFTAAGTLSIYRMGSDNFEVSVEHGSVQMGYISSKIELYTFVQSEFKNVLTIDDAFQNNEGLEGKNSPGFYQYSTKLTLLNLDIFTHSKSD